MIKTKDLTVLSFLVILSAVLSFFVSTKLFGSQKSLTTKVEVVQKVSGSFNYEDKPYFKNNPLNPTKDITVNENNNQAPLGQ